MKSLGTPAGRLSCVADKARRALPRRSAWPSILRRRVDTLTIGSQQQVEILKTLARDPRILILDEPTAILPPAERASLFRTIARLRMRGSPR